VLNLGAFSFITDNPWGEETQIGEIAFKNRHTPEFSTGYLERIGDIYRIKSDSKIQGIAPGQFGVIYNKEQTLCLGSGIIV
jgi:Predicted tRNA(5-methylaminomethyl-2-thiouridylate) methyltransferase, contains the PP-loop ATPase domain